jgi:hypothetical protein
MMLLVLEKFLNRVTLIVESCPTKGDWSLVRIHYYLGIVMVSTVLRHWLIDVIIISRVNISSSCIDPQTIVNLLQKQSLLSFDSRYSRWQSLLPSIFSWRISKYLRVSIIKWLLIVAHLTFSPSLVISWLCSYTSMSLVFKVHLNLLYVRQVNTFISSCLIKLISVHSWLTFTSLPTSSEMRTVFERKVWLVMNLRLFEIWMRSVIWDIEGVIVTKTGRFLWLGKLLNLSERLLIWDVGDVLSVSVDWPIHPVS